MKLSQRVQVGLDFYEFLNESNRSSITERNRLSELYNREFRSRNPGSKDPSFGSILYALRTNGKITVGRERVCFNPKVRALFVDQWSSSRTRQSPAARGGAPSPGAPPASTPSDEAETGVRARRKMATCLMTKLRTERSRFIADKDGVTITSDSDQQFNNGKLCLCMEDTHEYRVSLRVTNTGARPVYFTYYTPLHWLRHLALTDEHKVTRANPLTLGPGDSYEVSVHFRCRWVGFYPATLAFEFKPDLEPTSPEFYIVRFIEAQCVTALGLELAPIAPYKPLPLCAWTPEDDCNIVDGQRPDGLSVLQLKNVLDLKKYRIPQYVNKLIDSLRSGQRQELLETPLCWENYTQKFQLLLYLEECQMEVDIKRYNIPNNEKEEHAAMSRDTVNKKLLVLDVPGVSENRPSVLRGDQLLVCPAGETGVKYRGYVHSVELNRVKLGFSSDLLNRFFDGMRFRVEFTLNRTGLRLQHRAAELAAEHGLERVLFPAAPTQQQSEPPPDLSLFDRKLEANEEQYRAVKHIVAGSSKPAPYLVFGPPGTGKTVTMVEAIKQIEKTQASSRILVCAPSNSAADLLARKILDHVDHFKVFRMYASSRDPKCVPEELKTCSNLVGDCYVFPPREKLMEYRVVVTTLVTAGRLVTGGIPPGHFTHVFVDEAGHAVETECLIPLAGLLNPQTGQVVLAGDPKQLGPILRSPFALKYGLGVSLLQRLMDQVSLYQKDEEFNSRFVTKLLSNYRSHPSILKVPNELFYGGELLCRADEILCNSYCSWLHLPQPGFPLIFHGVTGVDEREASSPSFFNRAEVEVLMDYVKKLLQTQGKKGLATISPKDIGIIAPYRKQVQKIRQALNKVEKTLKFKDLDKLKVGSVEEFQGQERRVVLVSTVRSSSSYTDFDKQHNLGFVKNKKRFNVAVTRAKALLIVVGNPRVLNADPTWAHFIQFCSDSGGCDGITSSGILAEDEEDVVAKLALLYINMEGQVETAESVVQQQLDPEWRSDL